jgi:hypothetical protein
MDMQLLADICKIWYQKYVIGGDAIVISQTLGYGLGPSSEILNK